MQDLLPTLTGLDAVISDLPYAREHVPLYGELARLAKAALKPNGVLALMCGKGALPEVLAAMTPHLPYRWTLAYVFPPGGKHCQCWPGKAKEAWKPIMLFGHVRHWGTDVIALRPSEDDERRYHRWGQSESGMRQIIERLTRPNDRVCDPFMGGGSTAVACLALARRFVGCDVDAAAVSATRARLAALLE